MALRFEWLGLAEGSVEDGRGVIALVGLNQNVIVASELPDVVRRAIVIILVDEGEPALEPESTVTLAISVEGPDGQTIMSTTQQIQVGERRWPEIPGGINLTAQLQLSVTNYGKYVVRCAVTQDDQGDRIEATKEFYVVEEPAT